MHDQPEPSQREEEEAPARISDEEAMRYPGHEDPHAVEDPDPSSPDSE